MKRRRLPARRAPAGSALATTRPGQPAPLTRYEPTTDLRYLEQIVATAARHGDRTAVDGLLQHPDIARRQIEMTKPGRGHRPRRVGRTQQSGDLGQLLDHAGALLVGAAAH